MFCPMFAQCHVLLLLLSVSIGATSPLTDYSNSKFNFLPAGRLRTAERDETTLRPQRFNASLMLDNLLVDYDPNVRPTAKSKFPSSKCRESRLIFV
jgi:hypothetical protein